MSKKPPIGLKPKKEHLKEFNLKRLNEVRSAMQRYYDAELPIPVEWVEEHNELIKLKEDQSEEKEKQDIFLKEMGKSKDLWEFEWERKMWKLQHHWRQW